MSFSNKVSDFSQSLKRLAGHWRWLAALAVVLAIGAVYAGRKLSPAAPPAPPPVAQQAQAPTAPATPAAPDAPPAPSSPLVPPPTLDLNEPQAGAGRETPAELLASQTIDIAARPVAVLRGTGSWNDGLKTLSDAIATVTAAAAKAGLAVAGRPLVVFTETDDSGFHFNILNRFSAPPGVTAARSTKYADIKFTKRNNVISVKDASNSKDLAYIAVGEDTKYCAFKDMEVFEEKKLSRKECNMKYHAFHLEIIVDQQLPVTPFGFPADCREK